MLTIRFQILDKSNYHSSCDKFVTLYLHAFTTGEYAQHVTCGMNEERFDEMMCDGSGLMDFKAIADITQRKLRSPEEEFVMRKIYLMMKIGSMKQA